MSTKCGYLGCILLRIDLVFRSLVSFHSPMKMQLEETVSFSCEMKHSGLLGCSYKWMGFLFSQIKNIKLLRVTDIKASMDLGRVEAKSPKYTKTVTQNQKLFFLKI